jgi:hypothetical protein
MANQLVRDAAAALPSQPSEEQLHQAAEVVALAALESAKSVPGRAITRLIAHHFGSHSPDVRERVRHAALAVLDREAPDRRGSGDTSSGTAAPRTLYWPLGRFAVAIGLSEKRVRLMLRYPQWRRAWGWPRCWNGVDFWFLISAVEHPESSSNLDPVEPLHALPTWCLRVDQVSDMSEFPEIR